MPNQPLTDFYNNQVKVIATDADVNPDFNRVYYELGKYLIDISFNFSELFICSCLDLTNNPITVPQWFLLHNSTGFFSLLKSLKEYPFGNTDDMKIDVSRCFNLNFC